MTLTQEQVKDLKDQLKEQVSHLPENKRAEALSQIDSLSNDALEEIVKEQQERNQKTIFRMLVDGEVESVKVGENAESVAVLDINPISKGHIIIIPKKPSKTPKDIPSSCFDLAKDLSEKITSHLKAKSVKAETSAAFGESILNLIPIYEEELTKDSKRTKSNIEELRKIKTTLETIKIEKKVETIKIDKKTDSESQVVKLNRRIP